MSLVLTWWLKNAGSLRLQCLDELPGEWMLAVKTFSTMDPEGDVRDRRCKYDTRLFKSDKLGHAVCIKYGPRKVKWSPR